MPEVRDELLLLLQQVPDDLLPVVNVLGQHLFYNTTHSSINQIFIKIGTNLKGAKR